MYIEFVYERFYQNILSRRIADAKVNRQLFFNYGTCFSHVVSQSKLKIIN